MQIKRECVRGKSKSRGQKPICCNYKEEGRLKRDYPWRRAKQVELSGNAVVAEGSYEGGDILTPVGDGNACTKIFITSGTSDRGHMQVEKLGRKGKLGSEWRSKFLRWNNLQTGDRHSEQFISLEHCGLAELVVSCDAEVGNTTCRNVSFGGYTIVKLRMPGTSEEANGGLDLSDRIG
ncbi:hypothetical protein CRG98_013605 [Punica granatum]|uniref:Uncharacterized protein n=1 Tax=Punica granatum TaxID=22663 RepID=A0A2I0KCT8_PUNGR|nr:hypothetical protein CRG98_013605 [Punica granatum]